MTKSSPCLVPAAGPGSAAAVSAEGHREERIFPMHEYPIQDYAIIGNGETAALINSHGSIDWCCIRRAS